MSQQPQRLVTAQDAASRVSTKRRQPSPAASVRQVLYHCPHEFRKLPDIVLCRVERTHPAHHRLFFDPHIEEVPFLYLQNRVARNLRENAVRLHGKRDSEDTRTVLLL